MSDCQKNVDVDWRVTSQYSTESSTMVAILPGSSIVVIKDPGRSKPRLLLNLLGGRSRVNGARSVRNNIDAIGKND